MQGAPARAVWVGVPLVERPGCCLLITTAVPPAGCGEPRCGQAPALGGSPDPGLANPQDGFRRQVQVGCRLPRPGIWPPISRESGKTEAKVWCQVLGSIPNLLLQVDRCWRAGC